MNYDKTPYPIYKYSPFPLINKNLIFFDDYDRRIGGNNEETIIVANFLYVDGWEWKRCDGEFKYTSTYPFIPVMTGDKNSMQVIDSPCFGSK
jgi:hypothetical protein